MHRRHFERLVESQRRQDSRHASCHHRLARARWADQKQIVPAGGRDFERAAREQLAAHVGEIGDRSVGYVWWAGWGGAGGRGWGGGPGGFLGAWVVGGAGGVGGGESGGGP